MCRIDRQRVSTFIFTIGGDSLWHTQGVICSCVDCKALSEYFYI